MQHQLFGVRIDDLDKHTISQQLTTWLGGQRPHIIVTPNAEFLLEGRRDPSFVELLNTSDLSVPDSVSLRYAVAALSTARLLHRYPGVDLFLDLVSIAQAQQKKVLLLGGHPGAAGQSAIVLKTQHPDLAIVAHDPGFLKSEGGQVELTAKTLTIIEQEKPDVVAVALGQGKQERVMTALAKCFPFIKILIGIGGSLEMIAGQRQRSPLWMRQIGLEWLWRVSIEPQRLQRIVNASIVFPFLVAKKAFRERGVIVPTRHVFSEVFKQLRGL
ncbi:hypothetical protein CO174_01070 [Candidatus Uhrbacteria bacterium CG_4_9_14_3_um_filter_50_9]|uniref:Glycosyltransferase n=1 Tax=Candidatus Uhrbacteria bacterium CG_4_9_14_3_um_filter_50_9 TaxID=1975035 RepID=A0A2M7XDU4_9BACT|nr:MAG: hypothetical protein CO174_01070 [Candidatus Uhrbacteria bacterium CG_4_9_14_3_um_filter_50_9]